MSVHLTKVSKRFGRNEIFRDFSLECGAGDVTCILGPSGCGKTTLLRMIAGLLRPDGGDVPARSATPIGYVFQEPRLLPWKTALYNVVYATDRSVSRDERRERARRLLDMVELGGAADAYPHELSGGMARRVALARALAAPARLLVMDEPFASLDIDRKRRLVSVVKELLADRTRTVVCATHDLEVASTLADRILVFSQSPVRIVGDVGRVSSRTALYDRVEEILRAARIDVADRDTPREDTHE